MKFENAKQLADLLDGRQCGQEITDQEEKAAKAAGLVVVFGYSDDNCELRGAIHEEMSCWGGGTFYFNKDGSNFTDEDGNAKLTYFEDKVSREENWISVIAEPTTASGQVWATFCYETSIPHNRFKVWEDGEVYCRGIVFSINDLK